MDEQRDIFHDEKWRDDLDSFSEYLSSKSDDLSSVMKGMLGQIRRSAYEPGTFQLTEKEVGEQLRETIKYRRFGDDPLTLFLWIFRYLLELNARDSKLDQEDYIEKILTLLRTRGDDFTRVLEYWRSNTERLILKSIIQNPNTKSLESLKPSFIQAQKVTENVSQTIKQIDEELKKAEARLDNWRENLGFVELANGFRDMRRNKGKESKISLTILGILAAAIFLTPIIAHHTIGGYYEITAALALKLLPFAATEMILIYYFRLTYSRYKSIEAQKLQLDHRIALLQFIQRYAVFREKKEGMQKFEELIFSGIVASEEAIPSMFDGLEHIARLLHGAKEGAKPSR